MRPRWGVSLERSSDWLDGPQSSPAASLAVVPRDGGSRRLHRRSRCKNRFKSMSPASGLRCFLLALKANIRASIRSTFPFLPA